MTCRAVLFDLFDTLVLFHRDRLPEISVNGRTMRSTAGQLHAAFRDYAPAVELPAFVDALFWSWQEAERIRAEAHQEVTAPQRFDLLFGRLGFSPGQLPPEARDHEHRVALDGGPDGLDVQRRVIAEAPEWLAPGGRVLVESSEQQASTSAALMSAAGLRAEVAGQAVIGTRS